MAPGIRSPSVAKRARSEAEWGEIAAIGARLRKARRDAGLSQTALALRLNVRQPDISDWERGVHLPDPRVIALKRSIDGTHHHVSREHLARYLAEFDYRWSTRKLNDTARTKRLMGQVAGRRLTYRPLTGR